MKNTYVMIVATKLHPIKICRSTLRKFIKRKKIQNTFILPDVIQKLKSGTNIDETTDLI